jgi:two-component system cell cycle sensor histidine kinase/response regulator CckA
VKSTLVADAMLSYAQSLSPPSRGPAALGLLALIALACVVGVSRRARRRELRALRFAADSRARWDAVLDSALDCIITIDHHGRILDFNPAAERTFGYTRAEADGGQLADLVIPPHLRESHREGMKRYLETGHSRILGQRIEITAMRNGGDEFPVELAISAIELDGQPLFTAYIRDISPRKREEARLMEAETKYRTLVEKLPAVVYTADFGSAGRWHYVSPKIQGILGYSPEEWLADPNLWYERLHPEDRDRTMTAERYSATTQKDFKCEYRMFHRDGRIVWFRDESTILREEDGRSFMQGMMLDITHQKELEGQLRQSQKMEAVGQLAGGVAHDFNNLLAVMLNHAAFVQETLPVEAPAREDLAEIRKAAERAAALTRQLLLFSRKEVTRPQVVDLNEVVAGMEKLLRRTLGEGILLEVDLAPDVWPTVIDPGQTEQIIVNLAVNARDAMLGEGELHIATDNEVLGEEQARAKLGLEAGEYVRISVADTGRGMSEEEVARIFEPFYTTKPRGSGTGLGLSTVYGIVQQAGGSIAVETAVGVGSTFSIFLPASLEAVEATAPEDQTTLQAGNGATILVAEDEGGIRNLVSRILSAGGYRVLSAGSGEEALELLKRRSQPIDLLLTDVVMPRMSGSELAERVLKLQPDTQVLYMSGYTDNVIARHGVLNNENTFIQKPFTREDLLRKVEPLSRHRSGAAG